MRLSDSSPLCSPAKPRVKCALAFLQEGDVLSGRVDTLQLAGAEFNQVRCIVHLPLDPIGNPRLGSTSGDGLGGNRAGESGLPQASPFSLHAPPDLQLSFRASGLIGADVFRGVTLILDFPRHRMAVVQSAGMPGSGHGSPKLSWGRFN